MQGRQRRRDALGLAEGEKYAGAANVQGADGLSGRWGERLQPLELLVRPDRELAVAADHHSESRASLRMATAIIRPTAIGSHSIPGEDIGTAQ